MSSGVNAERLSTSHTGPEDAWTVLRLILWSSEYLKDKGVPNARLDSEHLLAHVVGVGRLQLYLEYDRPLSAEELDGFRPLLRRRAKREPLQYIVGRQPFRELDLEVDPSVLIPRSETELLVGTVLEWASSQQRDGLTVLDLGTGSGAVGLSLAFEGTFASVVATDVEGGALSVARRNRDSAGMEDRVELRLGSLFEPLGPREQFDIIVSNPPYVAESERPSLEPEVVEWEPEAALFAGPDGLDVVREIIRDAPDHLSSGGLLVLEVGEGQAGPVSRMIDETGGYDEVEVRRDYSGKERIVMARQIDGGA